MLLIYLNQGYWSVVWPPIHSDLQILNKTYSHIQCTNSRQNLLSRMANGPSKISYASGMILVKFLCLKFFFCKAFSESWLFLKAKKVSGLQKRYPSRHFAKTLIHHLPHVHVLTYQKCIKLPIENKRIQRYLQCSESVPGKSAKRTAQFSALSPPLHLTPWSQPSLQPVTSSQDFSYSDIFI